MGRNLFIISHVFMLNERCFKFIEGISAPSRKGPGLYEFLVEAELQHYFNSFK